MSDVARPVPQAAGSADSSTESRFVRSAAPRVGTVEG